ncbi:MAG: peptidoglycan-binding protein [Terriglobales bacterium]
MIEYRVRQGDCLYSIAKAHGYFWEVLWNSPENASLKQKRKDPSVLFPDDLVYFPDNNQKQQNCPVDQKHPFEVKTNRCKLKIRLLFNDEPRAAEPYTLSIGGVIFDGVTDGDGWLEEWIPPDKGDGRLTLPNRGEVHTLQLGHMDPITEVSGIQKRLKNLGFYIGKKADGILGPETASGVRAFQKKYGLVVDGIPGPKTQASLKEKYGC